MLLPKINLTKIITGHLKTLRSIRTNRPSINDLITFLLIPLIFSLTCVHFDVKIGSNELGVWVTILAILAGFSFNLLAIIFGYFDKLKANINSNNEKDQELKKIYLKEIHQNISFSILNSLFCIFFLLLSMIDFTQIDPIEIGSKLNIKLVFLEYIVDFTLYFSMIFYLFTLLMIIKRLNVLFKRDLN
ncbi:hypothetical protein BZG01_04280 [Labilibaculum manganireducens]|uniref:Uncharacterized protein n=1 Tax=Labilibaculum manganireducens TaxID=1940525 RepID=A0A2N3IDS8_9BACT|nr:hypothetical protein [Labilibaculum manganireducens]PKQ68438.1 hypothetical protein BZG01_04280 [Labilibaculum manganireducens]